MTQHDFDLFVIGGGSGGVRAARIAAQHGARVGIAEGANFGGTCVHRGCVPKKLMVYASRMADHLRSAKAFGWTVPTAQFSWAELISHKDTEIERLEDIYERNVQGAGAQTFSEHARLVDAHTVHLLESGRTFTAGKILIATGGRPYRPDFSGADLAITSDEVFHLPTQPKRILIVGGGYIAVEFASIFSGLGSEVTQFVRGPALLRGFDEEVAGVLREHLSRRGIRIEFNETLERIERVAGGLQVTSKNGLVIEVDAVMLSMGRRPNVEALSLGAVGVRTDSQGAILVNDEGRTNVESIFAIGDVTNRLNLTPVAIRQGQAFADHYFGGKSVGPLDHARVPTAVFTTPEVGVVGLPEHVARERFPRLRVLRTKFRGMAQAFAGSADQVFMKVLIDEDTDRVVGVHLLGDGTAEMIQVVAVALNADATWRHFRQTVALHPTVAEELVTLKG
jgi:glutathione reductase (NADPH)